VGQPHDPPPAETYRLHTTQLQTTASPVNLFKAKPICRVPLIPPRPTFLNFFKLPQWHGSFGFVFPPPAAAVPTTLVPFCTSSHGMIVVPSGCVTF
jgi:hypothetical protein